MAYMMMTYLILICETNSEQTNPASSSSFPVPLARFLCKDSSLKQVNLEICIDPAINEEPSSQTLEISAQKLTSISDVCENRPQIFIQCKNYHVKSHCSQDCPANHYCRESKCSPLKAIGKSGCIIDLECAQDSSCMQGKCVKHGSLKDNKKILLSDCKLIKGNHYSKFCESYSCVLSQDEARCSQTNSFKSKADRKLQKNERKLTDPEYKLENEVVITDQNSPKNPTVCALSEGGIAVAWNAAEDIYMMFYSALIYSPTTSDAIQADVHSSTTSIKPFVVCSGSQAMAVYQIYSSAANKYDIKAAVYISSGTKFTANFLVYTGANKQSDPRGAELSDGSFVVVYDSDTNTADDLEDIHGCKLTTSYVIETSHFMVNNSPTYRQIHPRIAASEGKYLVVWEMGFAETPTIYGSLFNNNGTAVANGIPISDTSTIDQDSPEVILLNSSAFLVCWRKNTNVSGEILCQILNTTPNFEGLNIVIVSETSETIEAFSIDAITSEMIVATWSVSTSKRVFAQLFDNSLASICSAVQISDTTESASNPRVSALPLNDFVVVWENDNQLKFRIGRLCENSHCLTCDNFQCTSCHSGDYLENGTCNICSDDCDECTSADTCTSCHSGKYLDAGSCVVCSTGCEECTGAASCTSCNTQFTEVSGYCECPAGSVEYNSNCHSCPDNCADCNCDNCASGSIIPSCIRCNDPYIDDNGNCECPPETVEFNSDCYSCPSNCAVCHCNDCGISGQSIVPYCTSCKFPYTDVNGICECSPGYAEFNSQCYICPDNCAQCHCDNCTDPNNLVPYCFDCNSPFVVNYGICECDSGFVEVDSTCHSCPDYCVECHCDSCSSPSLIIPYCTNCEDPFVEESGECECPSVTCLVESNCISCPSTCTECDCSNCVLLTCVPECTDCSSNYILEDGSCICPEGTVDDGSDCVYCPDYCIDCEIAGSVLECVECLSGFELTNGTCQCPSQTFEFEDQCVPCPSNCNVCNCTDCRIFDFSLSCEECIHPYVVNDGECVCPLNTTAFGSVCVSCPYLCEECNCDSCSSDSQVSTCTVCQGSLTPVNGICACSNEYVLTTSGCVECPENCRTCTCEDCSSDSTNIKCNECKTGYYALNNECVKCSDYCTACSASGACIECQETFSLLNGVCQCLDTYSLSDGRCELIVLSYSLTENTNNLLLVFSEDLVSSLQESNIEQSYFIPSVKNFTFIIEESSLSEYSLKIDSISVPSQTEGVHVEIIDVQGRSGAQLSKDQQITDFAVVDTEDYVLEEEEEILPIGTSSENTGSTASGTGVSASVGIAIVSANPSVIWIFLNFVILIYYMPLQNTGMSVEVTNFSKGFAMDVIGMIPGMDQYLNNTREANSPERWRTYGIVTTDLFTNMRNTVIMFAIGVSLVVLLVAAMILLRNKEGKVNTFVRNKIKIFRWCFFLRVWTQGYIKIMVAAFLAGGQVRFIQITDDKFGTGQVISIVLLAMGLLTAMVLGFFSYLYNDAIIQREEFVSRYGTFYDEFKCDRGWMSLMFYPLFFLRRFIYIFGIYCLEDHPLLQVIMNTILSSVVAIFLIIYRPFKKEINNFMNISLEIIIGIMFVLSGTFLLDLSENSEKVVTYLIFSCVIGVVLVILGSLIGKITQAIIEWRKKKKAKINPTGEDKDMVDMNKSGMYEIESSPKSYQYQDRTEIIHIDTRMSQAQNSPKVFLP